MLLLQATALYDTAGNVVGVSVGNLNSAMWLWQPSTLSWVKATADASGNLNVTSAGGGGGAVTANQGTAAALAGAWPVELTDGTNGPVAVKAASTAAVAADKAIVVAVSPNNSVAVTGTFWQTTQPVSGTVTANAGSGTFTTSDSHLPAAGALADNLANPTTTEIGSNLLAWDATNTVWRRVQVDAGTGTLKVDGSGSTQPVSGTVTANQGIAAALASAWPCELTDGTNGPVAVKAASTAAVATDKALVVAVSPNNTVSVTQSGAWSVGLNAGSNVVGKVDILGNGGATLDQANGSAVPTNGLMVGGGSVAGGTNFTVLTVKAASVAAVATDTSLVVQPLVGSHAMNTAAAGTQLVGISGNAAATLDAAIGAAAAPTNGLATLGVYNTTAPAPANGQSTAKQIDFAGNLFVQPYRRSNVKVATGTFTSTTATTLLAAQASGVFADLSSLSITIGLGTTANVFFTVNISDGTNTYKFNCYSPSAVTNVGPSPVNITFSPPIPAASAATAWTVALSSATDTPTVNVTATFVLQKAS